MSFTKSYRYIIYVILIIAIAIAYYLLNHHFNLISGKPITSDLCSVIFSKGCNNALISRHSSFLRVPMGGWGMVYLSIIGLFVIFYYWFSGELKSGMIQAAFWISASGITVSAYFMIMMIIYPQLFCPFCTVFHILNFTLFIFLKIETKLTFRQLFSGLIRTIGFVTVNKELSFKFKSIYWLSFILPFIVGLVIFQWVRMEGMKININILAAYSPLDELIKFDNSKLYEIETSNDDPMLGPSDVPVELIVFSDFQCEMCQMFATNIKDLIEFNQGKLKICYKYFPLSSECNPLVKKGGHPLACEAAYAAEAARMQDKFWQYHDSLFNHNLNDSDADIFFQIAESMQLNMKKFKYDYESDSCRLKVKRDIDQGVKMELNGTPSVFLNGHLVRDMRTNKLNFLIRYLSK